MATRVSATDAARNFSDLLNRVRYRGESFDVVRNGEVVAQVIVPPLSHASVGRLFELLEAARVDDGFAYDLERVQADQPSLPGDPWAT
jgi:antitoxin (DNA-binding transcriptional repressor) of toxin-antitoxin stability system